MSDNPWLSLPSGPPYVLAADEKAVREFNARARDTYRLQIDKLLPEPFLGDPAAPVLLLSNNPGFGKHSLFRQQPEFMAKMRACISLRFLTCPFVYLHPEYSEISEWWRQKLKCLLQKFGDEVVARSVCNIVYFPYPSTKFGHGRYEVPSQKYSFRLVQAAIERGALIVLMRKGQLRRWQDKVSELDGYNNLIVLRNPQMPSISNRNCEVGDYERVLKAIEAAEMNRQKATTDE